MSPAILAVKGTLNLRFGLYLKIVWSCALVLALWVYLHPFRLWELLLRLDAVFVVLAAVLSLAGMAVQWAKWHRLLRAHRPQTTPREGLESLLAGFALGLVSPGRLGELGRGAILREGRAALVGIAAVDRTCSFLVTLAAAALALSILCPLAGLASLLALFGLGEWARRKKPFDLGTKWKRLEGAWSAFAHTSRRLWFQTLVWSALLNLVFCTQFYLLLRSWGSVPFEVIWGIPLIFVLKALLPIGLLDLGVREGAAVAVCAFLGGAPAAALDAALLLFAVNVLLPGLAGGVLLWRHLGTLQLPGKTAAHPGGSGACPVQPCAQGE